MIQKPENKTDMKTALVTGGSKGIGLETTLRLVRSGHQVVTCSRSEDSWKKCLSRYPELAGVDYQVVDLNEDTQIASLFVHIEKHYGKLDIAVNNASPTVVSAGVFHQVESQSLQSTLHSDFWSHAICLKHEIKLMSGGGSIVNISSVNGFRPTPNAAMYSAAKHALEGLTRSLALENIHSGIRINAVAPGITWTPRWQARETDSPGIREAAEEMVPMKRFAEAREIVDAIEFLISDQASYILGHTLVVDGGLSLT